MEKKVVLEEAVILLCEHALINEYAVNPIGNLALRLQRTRILDFIESESKDIDAYIADLPRSIIPEIVEVALEHISPRLIALWVKQIKKERIWTGKITCDFLQNMVEDRELGQLIQEAELPVAINTKPL